MDQLESNVIGPKSFTGGRNKEWSQDMSMEEGGGGVLPTQLIELENFDVGAMGALIGRKGTNTINGTAINSGARIHSIYFYYKSTTSTLYCMVQAGTSVYTLDLSTGAATAIKHSLSATPMKWLTWNDNAYAFNGTGIYKFDGTTWSQIQDTDADCPDSVDGVVFQDVLFASRDGANKSRVPYSDDFDAEAWTATSFRRVRENDGQEIMGMDVVGDRIFCRRNNSCLYLHGGSIYDFAEEFLSEEVGQVGRMTGAVKEGSVMFQSNRGIEFFSPGNPKPFSNVSRDTCMAEIVGYTRDARDTAFGIYHPKTDRYLISYPDIDTPLIYAFFMNVPLLAQDGNLWFPHTVYSGLDVSSMAVDDTPGSAGKLYFGTTDGYVMEANYGYSDDGSAIPGLIKWGYTDCGIPNATKNFSRAFMPARCTGALQVTLDVDFGKKSSVKTTPSYTPEDVLIWDSGNWDEKVWASENVGTEKTRHLKMNGVRVAVQIQKSMTDLTEIHPFALEFFPKEKMRWP